MSSECIVFGCLARVMVDSGKDELVCIVVWQAWYACSRGVHIVKNTKFESYGCLRGMHFRGTATIWLGENDPYLGTAAPRGLCLQPRRVGYILDIVIRCLHIWAFLPSSTDTNSNVGRAACINKKSVAVIPRCPMMINGHGLTRVVASDPTYRKKDIVSGVLNWAEYTTVKSGNMLKKLESKEFPLSYHVGIFW
ncbi:hypothetical protein Tco_0994544 [Tanacetum coccineum]